jgi:hypothetical protein
MESTGRRKKKSYDNHSNNIQFQLNHFVLFGNILGGNFEKKSQK